MFAREALLAVVAFERHLASVYALMRGERAIPVKPVAANLADEGSFTSVDSHMLV